MFHLMSFCFLQIIDYQYIARNSSGLVFRSKRLAEMRGVFVCEARTPGLQNTRLQHLDYNLLAKHHPADLPKKPGVCGCPYRNSLTDNALRISPPPTCRRNGLAGKAARRKDIGWQ
jgi:hypothetical protein